MSTFCHGIASCQAIDKSGEIVDIKGLDITSLPRTGILNYEHKSDLPGQICGKILTAKKIFTPEDCSNDHETYFWNKCKVPFVYITAELLDDYCQSGKDAAGILKYDHDNKHKQLPILGFSVEGSEIPNTRLQKIMVMRSIARKTTLTSSPCNALCTAELLERDATPQIKDDFEQLFRSEQEAIEMFKTEQGSKLYEGFLLSKSETHKGLPPNWKPNYIQHKEMGTVVSLNHPEHGMVTVHQNPSSKKFEVKHAGKLAGVRGVKGSFNTPQEATLHAKNYAHGLSSGKLLGRETTNTPSNPREKGLNKAIEAGSYNAAPSTLVNGAAYQKESLGSKQSTTGMEDHQFHGTKKTDWKKRAKDEYSRWPKREQFEKFMKARMPHLALGEIQAIGKCLALNKSLDLEKALGGLIPTLKK